MIIRLSLDTTPRAGGRAGTPSKRTLIVFERLDTLPLLDAFEARFSVVDSNAWRLVAVVEDDGGTEQSARVLMDVVVVLALAVWRAVAK